MDNIIMSNNTIADKLQDLIDAKAGMKSAIEEKGVEVTGGLVTYADAITSIIPPIFDVIYFKINPNVALSGTAIDEPIVFNFNEIMDESYINYSNWFGSMQCPMVVIYDANDFEKLRKFFNALPFRSTTNQDNILNFAFEPRVVTNIENYDNGYIIKELTLRGYKINKYYA